MYEPGDASLKVQNIEMGSFVIMHYCVFDMYDTCTILHVKHKIHTSCSSDLLIVL